MDAQRRLAADDVQLFDGGRPLHVGGHEQRMATLLRQPHAQLRRRRRFSGSLEAKEEDNARALRRLLQSALCIAEQRDHFVADDPHDMLRRREAAENVLPHRPVTDAIDERLDDLEVDVGLEERETNLAKRGLDGFGRQLRLAPERFEDVLEACAERVEHDVTSAGEPA